MKRHPHDTTTLNQELRAKNRREASRRFKVLNQRVGRLLDGQRRVELIGFERNLVLS